MQGIRMDFYNQLPPKIGQRLLGEVLNQSLTILAVRYSQATPSLKRVPQYRADITAILLASLEILLSCMDSLHEFFSPVQSHKLSRYPLPLVSDCWCRLTPGCPGPSMPSVRS